MGGDAGDDRRARLEAAVTAAEDEVGLARGTMRVVVVGVNDGGGLSRVVARLARERGIADGEIVVVRSDPSACDREFAETDRTTMVAALRERLLTEERDEGGG